ncbi:MAG: Smr/MutS family protein [Acidobacteria bacterium]|nr:Smr/MutS family protein [Acidobacteriota bacterium]
MGARRGPRKSFISTINLEDGMPSVPQALSRLSTELAQARQQGQRLVKLIHGYGSSGVGGDLRFAIQRQLLEMQENGAIQACIFGEDWAISDTRTWKLLQSRPELKSDPHLGQKNRGITLVVF